MKRHSRYNHVVTIGRTELVHHRTNPDHMVDFRDVIHLDFARLIMNEILKKRSKSLRRTRIPNQRQLLEIHTRLSM